jgi:hypothetical protein
MARVRVAIIREAQVHGISTRSTVWSGGARSEGSLEAEPDQI